MTLTAREVAILEVLARPEQDGMYAGRIGVLAGFRRTTRIDTGTANTLRALERKGLVEGQIEGVRDFAGGWSLGSTKWWITDKGREALSAFAFGEDAAST